MDDFISFFASSDLWLTFSFLTFAWIVYSKGKGFVVGALDRKIEAIKTEFTEAENLRIEAQELLAQYQRKQNEAQNEADQIIKNAKEHAAEIIKSAEKDLAELVKRREKQLADKLSFMKAAAQEEMRERAALMVIEATQSIIEETITNEQEKKLFAESLEQIPPHAH